MCIKNPERTGGGVYFDGRYRRAGGGEDVDFCLRVKELHNYGPMRDSPAIVGVPEAEVIHPFWSDGILKQVSLDGGPYFCSIAPHMIEGNRHGN
jgi:hypothetical protein